MSSSDWDEIKRLAADFQRAQLTSSFQRLSERNCVEIINKLIEHKLIKIYFTLNGKEYITPSYLVKQIQEELFVHQGRINLTELSSILDVSLNVIEKEASKVTKVNSSIQLILGQLISEDYLNALAEEVNEKLQLKGFITVGEIAQTYDLPGDFILNSIHKRLGNLIKGKQDDADPSIIFTNSFVSKHEYQIRGILTAITHPTPVANIIVHYNFQERLFFSTVEKLLASNVISGSISGGKVASQAVIVPSVYSKSQFDWVSSFLKHNGYLEFKSLKRLGIFDPHNYILKSIKDQKLTFVTGACVGQLFIDQITANVDDALANDSYVDILPFLPSEFSGQVCLDLINMAIKTRKNTAKATGCSSVSSNCLVFCDSIVISENLLTTVALRLEQLMPSKAKEEIAKGAFKQQLNTKMKIAEDSQSVKKRDDRRKKATGGKSGGGTQGRETKTKSTKNKKGRRGAYNSDDEENSDNRTQKGMSGHNVEFLSVEEIVHEISKYEEFEDSIEDFLFEVSNHLHESVSRKFQTVLRETFFATVSEGDSRKKNHQHLQEKVIALLCTVRLAEKSLKEFSEDTIVQLSKYLLRSHCSEIVNEIVLYLADDSQIDLKDNKELSPELRMKIITQLDDDLRSPLTAVHKSLTAGVSIEEFLSKVDDAVAAADIIYKKKDNKRDRQVLLSRRGGLIEQLNACLNFASCLHLSCLIVFQVMTGNLLHASGKFVPQILAYLQLHLSGDFYDLLREYQSLVMTSLTSKESENMSSVNTRLEVLTPRLKEQTIIFKKPGRDRDNSVSED